MGPEILGGFFEVVGALVGFCLLALLLFRSVDAATRPFALSTLVASILWATFWSWYIAKAHPSVASIATAYFFFFGVGAVLFGLHAHAIKWLLVTRT